MNPSQLVVLLPCASIEDFSLDREGADAEQILAGWSALWHPALLSRSQRVPTWYSAEGPPQDPAGHLVVIPDSSAAQVPEDWLADAEAAGACLLRDYGRREELIARLIEELDEPPPSFEEEWVADFLALGVCHLFVELLTRQLRYMSNLDEESFRRESVAAADALCAGDTEGVRSKIQAAFDLLNEAREYFYPVQAHLLDLTLVAPTTVGASLRDELAGPLPTNLLISGHTVAEAARREPATIEAIRTALEKKTATLVGGEFREVELPLLDPEAIRRELLRGSDAYERHLGQRPETFGRRRFGLSPVLPGILRGLGVSKAIHFTLDDGRFPAGNQSRVQWQGLGGAVVEALARIPIDVSRPENFLRLPERLGDSMDLDHVATVVLAHWPGHSSPWYDDLRRIARYTSVLGTFASMETYFEETQYSGQQVSYTADQYRAPYLTQAVGAGRPDPISRWVSYYRRQAVWQAAETLRMLAALVGGAGEERVVARSPDRATAGDENASTLDTIDALLEEPERGPQGEAIDRRLQAALDRAAASLAGVLADAGAARRTGRLLLNTLGVTRRVCVELPAGGELPPVGGAIRAAEADGRSAAAVADVPPMGFAWIGPGMKPPEEAEPRKARRSWFRRAAKPPPPMAEVEEGQHVLRNEFFEITFDPATGAIRAVSDYVSRRPRLAQQLALRIPRPGSQDPGSDENYSIMAADEIAVTSAGPIVGEVLVGGRLVDREGKRVAGFRQTTRTYRGSRLIELAIELDIERQPTADPWHSYYGCRFAWSDETANVYRSVSLANVPTDAAQIEAPHFVDLAAGKLRTTFLTGGLPYHRRFGLSKLDTLLIVRGETARRFQLAVGVDLPHPVPAALEFLTPGTAVAGAARPPISSGWLFHLDSRHAAATHWEPLAQQAEEGACPPEKKGAVPFFGGLRVRLLETDGRKLNLGLRCFRTPASAKKIKPGDSPDTDLSIEGDRVTVPLDPHEWAEVEVRFAGD